jgi:ComF family protein
VRSLIVPFAKIRSTLLAAERFLLPPACLLCGVQNAPTEGEVLVCGLCRSRWHPVPSPVCDRCGQPRSAGDPACRMCEWWPDGLGRVRSAVWLTGGARTAVHLLKFEGWWRAADSLALVMGQLEPLTEAALLIPIPLGSKRRRKRGYNQSEHIAWALGGERGMLVGPDRLTRVRETQTQSALTPEGRLANVRGAFRATGVASRRVVLVDDVFTTGATLVAAASALGSAGATRVDAVTFARAEGSLTTPDARH